jgi:hypothetical protein
MSPVTSKPASCATPERWSFALPKTAKIGATEISKIIFRIVDRTTIDAIARANLALAEMAESLRKTG